MWVDCIKTAQIPDNHIALMSDAGALSAQLRRNCKELTVALKSQELSAAFQDEQALLKIDENNSLVRKVHILGDKEPWIHGRVVAPHITYQKFKNKFDTMGNKLLGETLLYDRPHVSRSSFQYAKVSDNLWGRRSMFTIEDFKLLVTEIFLPNLLIKSSR